MGKCPFCGNNIDDDTLYCRCCGKKIYPYSRINKNGSGKEVWIILLLIFMWPIGLISMWLTKTFSNKARWIITLIFASVILITAVSVAYKVQEIRLSSGEQTVENVTDITGDSTIEQPKVLTQNDFTAIVFIIITVTSIIIYFVVHKSKREITKYSHYSSKTLTSEADTYNQNSFELEIKKENISEKSPTLIKCPVCNKDVSSQAIACPNCGHPIASNIVNVKDIDDKANEEAQIDYSSIIDYSNSMAKPIKGVFKHINGLNILENAQCEVLLYPDRYEFKSGTLKFNLSKSKVIDVTVKTDREIQQQYVSSIGGAVAGGVLFGPLGAIIGGRAKKKAIKTYSSYLIITYKDNGNIKYIGFDVTNAPFKAKKFESEFKKNNNTITRVDL